jgi:nitrilase
MAFPSMRAAACHISPHLLSSAKSTQKTISCVKTAAKNSANLVVFPESSIPGFPVWSSVFPPASTQTHHFFQRMVQESLYLDGPEISEIRQAARDARVIVSLGMSEKVRYSSATLFNTNLIIGENGEVLVHHRKLMPTFFEKLTWSPGDGHGLRVASTQYGKIGALICGENTNPLARYALMAQGEQIHVSSWPSIWPTRPLDGNKTENLPAKSGRNYDNIAANRMRAAAHCFEAKCFGIMSASHLDEAAMAEIANMSDNPNETLAKLKSYPRAGSQVLDPTGRALDDCTTLDLTTNELLDGQAVAADREAILLANLDLSECIEGKQYHDIVGGYQRFDIFSLNVNRQRHEPVLFTDEQRHLTNRHSRENTPDDLVE